MILPAETIHGKPTKIIKPVMESLYTKDSCNVKGPGLLGPALRKQRIPLNKIKLPHYEDTNGS